MEKGKMNIFMCLLMMIKKPCHASDIEPNSVVADCSTAAGGIHSTLSSVNSVQQFLFCGLSWRNIAQK